MSASSPFGHPYGRHLLSASHPVLGFLVRLLLFNEFKRKRMPDLTIMTSRSGNWIFLLSVYPLSSALLVDLHGKSANKQIE